MEEVESNHSHAVLIGSLLIMISALLTSIVGCIVKYGNTNTPVIHLLCYQFGVCLACQLKSIIKSKFKIFQTKYIHIHLLRSVVGCLSFFC